MLVTHGCNSRQCVVADLFVGGGDEGIKRGGRPGRRVGEGRGKLGIRGGVRVVRGRAVDKAPETVA